VSSVLVHPTRRQAQYPECARLIPGEMPASRSTGKKPARSVRSDVPTKMEPEPTGATALPESLMTLLAPHPLHGRTAWECLRSIGTDCALIALNWFSLGVLLLLFPVMFPDTPLFEFPLRSSVFLLGVSLLHGALITLLGYTEELYKAGADLRAQTKSMGKSVLWGSVVLCFAYGLQGSHWTSSCLICFAGSLHFGSMWLWRRWGVKRGPHGGIEARNVLIIGAGGVGRRVARYIERHPGCGRRICGFLDDKGPLGNDVVGRVSDLALMARRGFVDEVILAAPHDRELALHVFAEAKRLRLDLEIVPELFGCDPAEQEVEHMGGLPVICVHAERLPAPGLVVKRMIDIVGASLGLIVLSPLMLAIALLVKVNSFGPVLYAAKRAGKKGRPFRCYKFRTMVSDADQCKSSLQGMNKRSGPIFKVFDDPRITRVGRLLRRYSLDELPQLWNVMKGEMSLVGPRPHPVDEFAAYELSHLARLDVTPGMTGLWQVSARRDPSFDRAMELDREYIRTWNLGLDSRILLRTVFAVVRGSGD
jgi:exopolysaccharide biosynthesis polyprenyl glycosylphosphotransferase